MTRAVPPPRSLWMVRPTHGAVQAQTRVPKRASVPAEGGGTATPTQGGGFWFSRDPYAAGEGSP
jgi:hypothetical protein